MEKIKNFILPEHTNGIYMQEAISSVSLTRDIAEKINELIDAYNTLSNDDTEWKLNQESNIRKAIVYMKDNLLNSLEHLMDVLNKNGFIDDRIEYHCKDLKERVNNLLGSVTTGTTTMDAEIIDARMDSDKAVWLNIGNLIRSLHELTKMVFNDSYFITEKVDTPIINGWLDRAGVYQSNASTGDQHKCIKFEVAQGDSYLIYSEYGWDMADAVALDKNNTMVKIYNTAESRQTNDGNYIITVPDKAKYLVVNCMYPSKKPVSARKIIKCTNKSIVNYVNNAVLSLKGTKPVLSDNLITSVETGKAIRACEVFNIDNQGFVIGTTPVNEGQLYQITCGGSFECNYYTFYDATGTAIDYSPVTQATGYTRKTFTVFAPIGASYITVADYEGVTPTVKKITGYTTDFIKDWNHLKWVCLGDSLTEVNSRTDKRYYEYIQDKTGIEVVNMGVGGTGYKRGEDNSQAFYQRVNANDITGDVITIFGSGNDNPYFENIGSPSDKGTSTLCGCINTTIDNILAKNPLVKIGVISPTPWINHTPDSNSKFKDYTEALKEICLLRGIPFLDLFHLSEFRPNEEAYRNLVFSKDDGNGVHPNEIGHKIISSHIYNFLNSLIGTY